MSAKEKLGKAVATAGIASAVLTGGSTVGSPEQANDAAKTQERDQRAATTRNADTATRANSDRKEQQP